MKRRSLFCMLSAVPLLYCMAVSAQEFPKPTEGDFVVPEFHFKSGEVLKNMRLHYTAYGKAVRDASGRVINAVMILHGSGGSGQQFTQDKFADVLFGPGHLRLVMGTSIGCMQSWMWAETWAPTHCRRLVERH